ncbi:hypothetical protein ACIA8O_38875 [Kitasatospora sp. NPDC051853]|uniref:hypothetical protein n=1 Tax=Kitasatospora sp. NPDC051853 TaxID=3364058 RepID=UPI00378D541E
MTRTLTGRRQADRIAHCTAPAADTWIDTEIPEPTISDELEAADKLRFATEVAALTGTDPTMWLPGQGDGTETRRRLVAQGATAILRTDRTVETVLPTEPGDDFAEMEAEITNEAARDRVQTAADQGQARVIASADRRERARGLARAEYTEVQLAAFGDDPFDAWSRAERDAVDTWSPWGSGPRWADTRRAVSGPRRKGGPHRTAGH